MAYWSRSVLFWTLRFSLEKLGALPALTAPNWPVHLRTSMDKWPKELNPTIKAKLREEVVDMSTDFANYFSQLALAPSMLWMHIVHWAGLDGVLESALGAFVFDERVGFGASIGQRLSHTLNGVFRRISDTQKEAIYAAEVLPLRQEYLDARQKLGPCQCRLYVICTGTEDPFLVRGGKGARLARAVTL